MKEEFKNEFEKTLFERASSLVGDDSEATPLIVEESPEVKKARANVNRIINNIIKEQMQEMAQNNINVKELQESSNIDVGDIKVTENYLNKFAGSDMYKVKLSNFEGPLDLLLYLIKDSKLEIENIKLANITEQYLSYMKDLDTVDMEMAAEFIEVTATMVEIKSKSLIPQEQEKQVDENDPEWLLMQRLKEYKMYKEASEKMKKQD